METVLNVLVALSLVGVLAYAFAVYEVLARQLGPPPPAPQAASLGADRRFRALLPGGGAVMALVFMLSAFLGVLALVLFDGS